MEGNNEFTKKWDALANIPFKECQVKRDNEKEEIQLYHAGQLVLSDYDHIGHYMKTALWVFFSVKDKRAKWVNLQNLFTLRNCIRENINHGLGVDNLIFGPDFDGENLETVTPLTKARFDTLVRTIKELDQFATV